VKHKELKAQILYRLEQYDDSYDVYRDILKNSSDDDFEVSKMENFFLKKIKVTLTSLDWANDKHVSSGCKFEKGDKIPDFWRHIWVEVQSCLLLLVPRKIFRGWEGKKYYIKIALFFGSFGFLIPKLTR